MKSIITTYRDFQSLPRGVKMMLLVSENLFFSEVKSRPPTPPASRHPYGSTFSHPNPGNPSHRVQRPFQ